MLPNLCQNSAALSNNLLSTTLCTEGGFCVQKWANYWSQWQQPLIFLHILSSVGVETDFISQWSGIQTKV